MENSHKLKGTHKTKRRKVPAPYSPQRFRSMTPSIAPSAVHTPIAPVPSKKKPMITSYSVQFWQDNDKISKPKSPIARSAGSRQIVSQQENNKKTPRISSAQLSTASDPRRCQCHPSFRRLDPSALHLKYGVFPQRKQQLLNGNVSTAAVSKPSLKKLEPQIKNVSECILIERKIPSKSHQTEIAESEMSFEAPQLVFRPLARCQLSSSAVYHVDIKPRTLSSRM